MADNKTKENNLAADAAFSIVCPYCFNMASNGKGRPFSHKDVEFRAETYFSSETEILKKLHYTEVELALKGNAANQEKVKEFEKHKRFLVSGKDEKYNAFWANYEGRTTEQAARGAEKGVKGPVPWELPVIKKGDGVAEICGDVDGFVTHAVDEFGKITHRRVCPHCHNPLPLGYGKYPVKYISIIGITGAGKTVYISQLLKGMSDYASKSGLNAYFTSDHETNFIEANVVKKGAPLPESTSPGRLSQPMFYDIVRTVDGVQHQDTIVLYDIAGENCRRADDMVRFSSFVEHSDGLILLVDPKQLGFLSTEVDEDDIDAPSLALNTLHGVLESAKGKKSNVPIAVCVSKSDQCVNILPTISQEQVQNADPDESGLIKREFDGRAFNSLSEGIRDILKTTANTVCQNLATEYWNYNFFAVSAIGCGCEPTEQGFYAPVSRPNPKRIEEPILWLFKQFGFISSNQKVMRPFKIKQPERYIYKKPFIGKPYLIAQEADFAVYEEDKIREHKQVLKKNVWTIMSDEDKKLEIR